MYRMKLPELYRKIIDDLIRNVENLELKLERKEGYISVLNDEITILKNSVKQMNKKFTEQVDKNKDLHSKGWEDGISYAYNTNDCEYCGRKRSDEMCKIHPNKCKL